jgi:nucleotide-binding universal stress UspA family protein
MYQKILLAYDGSVAGRRALREGAALALLCHAEIFLLAVVDIQVAALATAGIFTNALLEKEPYEAELAEGVQRLETLGFRPQFRLGVGYPGQQIVEVATEIGADLVVAGHRHKGPLTEWWSGSVGNYLVKNLKCSVLIGKAEISDERFTEITKHPESS